MLQKFARRLGAAFFLLLVIAAQPLANSRHGVRRPPSSHLAASEVPRRSTSAHWVYWVYPLYCTRVRYTAGYTIVQPGYSGLVRAEVLGQTFCALRAAFWDLAPLLRGVHWSLSTVIELVELN